MAVLEGLFGDVGADAIDAEPNLELAADTMGVDIDNDAKGAAATADGGMMANNDGPAANNVSTLCATYPCLEAVNKIKDVNASALIHQTLQDWSRGLRNGGPRRGRCGKVYAASPCLAPRLLRADFA